MALRSRFEVYFLSSDFALIFFKDPTFAGLEFRPDPSISLSIRKKSELPYSALLSAPDPRGKLSRIFRQVKSGATRYHIERKPEQHAGG